MNLLICNTGVEGAYNILFDCVIFLQQSKTNLWIINNEEISLVVEECGAYLTPLVVKETKRIWDKYNKVSSQNIKGFGIKQQEKRKITC